MANPNDWFKDTPVGAAGHVALTVNNDSEDKTFEELKTKIAAQVGRNVRNNNSNNNFFFFFKHRIHIQL